MRNTYKNPGFYRLLRAQEFNYLNYVKTTAYFRTFRHRPDRAIIRDEWLLRVINMPEREVIQDDGRIRRWARIPEWNNRYLRVILLSDGQTVHNAFFDRRYKP